jgi:hypothetical protein
VVGKNKLIANECDKQRNSRVAGDSLHCPFFLNKYFIHAEVFRSLLPRLPTSVPTDDTGLKPFFKLVLSPLLVQM